MELRSKCFLIGCRDTPEALYPAILEAVKEHIAERGVREFLVGHYGAFDRLAAAAVREAKRTCPEARLTLLLPYHPGARPVSAEGFDESWYPFGDAHVPARAAIVRTNRHAVRASDFLIAYAPYPGGGAHEIVGYARHSGLCVTELYVPAEFRPDLCGGTGQTLPDGV
ncbi:MAG: hypothetical protein II836_04125 [Clostridia bacterium]|nr:hypothetical protein [Clostridia bacterium]